MLNYSILICLTLFSGTFGEICRPYFDYKQKEKPLNWYWQSLWEVCGEKRSVCYNDPEPLGCFKQGSNTAFCQQIVLPESPQKIEPEFWLYTPEKGASENQTVNFFHLNQTLIDLQYNASHQLWVIVHGFGDDWPKTWMFPMKDALIAKGHNVLICRWTKGSKGPDYFQASANTRIMGAMIARIVTVMGELNHVTLPTTTIVGFSLGAHVAGFAGAILGRNLKKIVGLDPAGPLFQGEQPEASLDKEDAGFVMCMHTNGEALECGGAGTMQEMGHVDFYANGGQVQPPCPPGVPMAIGEILHFNFSAVMGTLSCSHCRAPWLFTNAIMLAEQPKPSCEFLTFPCDSDEGWNAGNCFDCGPRPGCPIGLYEIEPDSLYEGMYTFGTRLGNNSVEPYCGNVYKLRLLSDKEVKGSIDIQMKFANAYNSIKFPFQKKDEASVGGTASVRMFTTKYQPKLDPISLIITYQKHESLLPYEDGFNQIKLIDITLFNAHKKSFYVEGNVNIQNGIPATVALVPYNEKARNVLNNVY